MSDKYLYCLIFLVIIFLIFFLLYDVLYDTILLNMVLTFDITSEPYRSSSGRFLIKVKLVIIFTKFVKLCF